MKQLKRVYLEYDFNFITPYQKNKTKKIAAGRNPFNHYHVPQAAIALKQGAGRLIRRETDRGMLVVCDVRLAQMGYGRRIIEALPPMRRITLQEQFGEVLASLVTRPSTKDH